MVIECGIVGNGGGSSGQLFGLLRIALFANGTTVLPEGRVAGQQRRQVTN